MNRNVKLGIIIALLLVLAVAGFSWYYPKYQESKFLKTVDRNLTADDRRVFEERIAELQNKLASTNDGAVKYNYYLEIGSYKYAFGLLQESKDNYNEAIKITSDQYDVYVRLFLTQADMQDYKGAEESIRKAISIRKGVGDFWRRYIQFKIDRLNASTDEVERLFAEALNDTKYNGDAANYADVLTFYATWLEKAGNLQGAMDNWKKAIEVLPEKKTVYQAEIDRIQKLIK